MFDFYIHFYKIQRTRKDNSSQLERSISNKRQYFKGKSAVYLYFINIESHAQGKQTLFKHLDSLFIELIK